MLTAGLAFAIINSLTQIASIHFGLASTTVAVIQYAIAFFAILPYLQTLGIRRALQTNNLKMHIARVFLSVIGIQLWIWALAYPVPIWQGIASTDDLSTICDCWFRVVLKRELSVLRAGEQPLQVLLVR